MGVKAKDSLGRTYVGELEWVFDQVVGAWYAHYLGEGRRLELIGELFVYGMDVMAQRRLKGPLPPRPDVT